VNGKSKSWRLAVGGWRLAVGGWRLAVKLKLPNTK